MIYILMATYCDTFYALALVRISLIAIITWHHVGISYRTKDDDVDVNDADASLLENKDHHLSTLDGAGQSSFGKAVPQSSN